MANESQKVTVTRRLIRFLVASVVSGAMLAPPAAHAFTFEDGKGNQIPKFDLEEQTRHFRTPQLDTSTIDKRGIETPLGTLQFGVQRNAPMFGSPFGSDFGSNSGNADRRHYERLFAPPGKQHLYD
jgi:hypothetical protein